MLPKLPNKAKKVLATIAAAGGYGFLVGGTVRDLLRGEQPHNWHFAATLTPKQLLAAFAGAYLVNGLGDTVKIPFGNEGGAEVISCCLESDFISKKHLNSAYFLQNIFLHLARKDFTVNAMAYDGNVLIDPFGGQQDLKNNMLRCVGRADACFKEDPLRILRMYRFSATLGMRVEWHTLAMANKLAGLVVNLNCARIRQELSRILLSNGPQVLNTLIARGALRKFGFAFAPSLAALADVPCNPLCRWWALMALCGADFEISGKELGFSQQFQATLAEVTRLYRMGPAENKVALKKKLHKTELDYAPLSVVFAAVSPVFAGEPVLFANIHVKKEPYRLSDLAVNADMLVFEGFSRKHCNQVLNKLLITVIETPELNEMHLLLGIARELKQIL